MAVSVIGVLSNSLLIVVIVLDPLLIIRRGPWITIFNLAIADFIASLSKFLILGLGFAFKITVPNEIMFSCFYLWMLGAAGSFFLLTSLTWQTYTTAKHPMHSRQILSTKKITILCVTIWFVAGCLALGEISHEIFDISFDQVMHIYITEYAVLEFAVFLQIIMKCFIIKEVMLSRRNANMNGQQQNSKHIEIAKTIVILNIVLFVTAFPYFVAKQVEFIERLGKIQSSYARHFAEHYEPVALLNFALNPILYALRLTNYRNSLKSLFKCVPISKGNMHTGNSCKTTML
ncbi:type-1 angiotensin II receptor A-like [Xenia sp. Carnegie-2017]|uniref:type-1 angiotensin II receptor A-like n=1 Tax=Xenia sp. Carnegie-2017 TaxID=2897299 RepID=UPI001F04B247|nr:type-1 angiotensin II receptor A-like [Xenia sp. Carnegie-2017]